MLGFFKYVFGPKLYMQYGTGTSHAIYEPRGIEKVGDQILSTLSIIWNLGCYSSPFVLIFLYRRGYLVAESFPILAKFTTSIGIIVFFSLCMRGFGRSQSRSYTALIEALEMAKTPNTPEDDKCLHRLFDFDFRFWHVDFDVCSIRGKPHLVSHHKNERRLTRISALPCEILAYIAIHTFGIRMIYPGSIKLLQSYMRSMLIAGRAKLTQVENGKRYKIRTTDLNEIDALFVDNRFKGINGKTLVICSEGNAGFYEIGIMATPLFLKYSVLGWNHPGFEGSTGKPFPEQDKNAIEGVIQFAVSKLKFQLEDIILYGWSIGGFSTAWGAFCFPDVKGVILDATFDDILHLALARMPTSLAGIVKIAIRQYCNLNISEILRDYHGPLLLIRRTEDEIIAEDGNIYTNRGNYLALSVLKHRYPNIFKVPQLARMKVILSQAMDSANLTTTHDDICKYRLISYVADQGKVFPLLIGSDYTDDQRSHMAEFLLRKHLQDYKSTHCTPLPEDFFNIPWDIPSFT